MKVLVADDHALIREGLVSSLVSMDAGMEVVQAEDRESVIKQLDAHRDLDVILLDLFMPGTNGFDLLSEICDEYSTTPVIVISAAEEPRYMRKSIDTGASGFIPKSASMSIMLSAIQLVVNGGVYIPSDLIKKQDAVMQQDKNASLSNIIIDDLKQAAENLTARQAEVLTLMAKGLSNKEIGRALEISEHTIKIHVAGILRVLNASNRTEAVVMAQNAGILMP